MSTVTLRPNGDHTAQWTDPSGGSHYTDVSDNNDATYLVGSSDQIDLFHFQDSGISTGVINSVTFYFRGGRTSTSTITFLLYDVGGTYSRVTAYTEWADNSVGKTTVSWVPAASWTWAYIDAIRCGAQAKTANNFALADIWVIVDYTAPPSTPTGVTASDGTYTDKVAISWSAGSGGGPVTGYYVYRDGEEIEDTASTSYDDEDAVAGIVYTYTVKAYGDGGTSAASDGNTGFMERSNLFTFHG